MVKQTLLLLLWLGVCLPARTIFAQCNPSAPEIPGNGFDEDCDGLDDIFLAVPPFLYATVGQDVEIYFRNLILSKHPQDYVFSINAPVGGTANAQKWTFTPTDATLGEFPLTITVRTPGGQFLASGSTILRVSPSTAPADMAAKKLWLFGHSFFDQGYMPKYIFDLLQKPANPPISFHGKKASWANANARHEGYGGMMARWFFNDPGSPIRYGNKINMRQYFNDVCGWNQRPDWIVFHLDINDFCGYSALAGTTLKEIEDSIIGDWNRHATRLLDSIRVAAPNAIIAICISPPPNARESAFASTYGSNPVLNNRWRWQKIINRLIFKNIERYGNRENERIYLIPEHLDIDDFGEYNPPDARHPDPPDNNINTHCGYNEIAKQIYAWLRWVQHHPQANLTNFFQDADNDGFGNPAVVQQSFSAPAGYVSSPDDCNDANPNVHPGATENCTNQLDDDCDTQTDEDAQAPEAHCKISFSLPLDASGEVFLQPSQLDAGSSDACGPVSLTLDRNEFYCSNLGYNYVKLRVRDASGNESECQTAVEIVDKTPPNALCFNTLNLSLSGAGTATLTAEQVNNGSWDACGGMIFSIDKTHFSCADLGQKSVTLTVTDPSGNNGNCKTTVNVLDQNPPIALCVNALELNLDAAGQAVLEETQLDAGSWDECGVVSFSISKKEFDCSEMGQNQLVHLTVFDASNNLATCSTTVAIHDKTSPNALCISSISLPLDENGKAVLSPEQIDAGSWDVCGSVTLSLDKVNFDCSNVAQPAVATLAASDTKGNVSTCQSAIYVSDYMPPKMVCKNVELAFDENHVAQLTIADLLDSMSDNCGFAALVPIGNDPVFFCGQLGKTFQFMLHGVDASGNYGECVASVTLVDVLDFDGDGATNCTDECPQNADLQTIATYYWDSDGDGFGGQSSLTGCLPAPAGAVAVSGDCDDANPLIFPGAEEILNEKDDDCNGKIDDGLVGTQQPNEIEEPMLKLFPNPTFDRLTVEWQAPERWQAEAAWVCDPLGRQILAVREADFSFGKIGVTTESLPSGLYFLKIKFHNGWQTLRQFQKI